MPVLSTTTYYSGYPSNSSLSRNGSSASSTFSSLRPYSASSLSQKSLSSVKSRSSYDLTAYRPSNYLSTHSTSTSYKSPSSLLSTNTSTYSSSRYSTGISGLSSSPSSVTLTRYNQRRSSLDYTEPDIPSKISTPVAGLTNLGNTCYMNSVLQALFATKSLRDYITNGYESSGGTLFSGLCRLFKEMSANARTGYVNPSSFRQMFISYQPKFRGYDQHDAQEFLRYLINGLHDEVNKAKKRPKTKLIEPNTSQEAWNQYKGVIDDSRLIDLFVGQFSSVIKCTECHNTSSCWDPFFDLSLPVSRTRCDIEDLIEEFTAQEVLDGGEQPFCSRCKCHRRSTKRLTIQRSPQILILHLKKFANDGFKLSSQDISVNANITIDGKTYHLYACVCHHGYSSRSGHYTAYCQYDNKWFHLNDERVKDVSDTFNPTKLTDAYVLFYHNSSSYSSRL